MKSHHALLGALAVTVLSLGACRNTAEGVKKDSEENAAKARQEGQAAKEGSRDAADKSGDKAKEVGDKVAEGAKEVGEKIKEGAKDIGTELGASKQTLDVKAALMADKNIDASHIDVDSDASTRTVSLKGTVPTAAQKAAAEKVARDKADGYSVRNLLTVAKS
jgi:osmotically-inducible protein OsmY/predicted small secreted protein